jgi:hypothetical protein
MTELVLVAFREVKPDSDSHQRGGNDYSDGDAFAKPCYSIRSSTRSSTTEVVSEG